MGGVELVGEDHKPEGDEIHKCAVETIKRKFRTNHEVSHYEVEVSHSSHSAKLRSFALQCTHNSGTTVVPGKCTRQVYQASVPATSAQCCHPSWLNGQCQ